MRLLVFRTDRLGEFLLTLVAIKLLKDFYIKKKENPELCLVLNNFNASLIPALNWVDDWLIYEEYKIGQLAKNLLIGRRYDLAVVFNPHKILHFLAFVSGAKVRVGYSRKWSFFLNKKIVDQKFKAEKHEIFYNLDLVSLITGISYDNKSVEKILPELFSFDDILPDLPYELLVIHPFTSDPRKEVPLSKWQQLLANFQGRDICVIGSKSERERSVQFLEQIKKVFKGNIINMVGDLDLYQLGVLLKYHTELFYGLDSGPAHFAALLGKKVYVFWSYASWIRWHPWRTTKDQLLN